MRGLLARGLVVAILATAGSIPAHSALAFSDVPSGYWDATAIRYVATTHPWMQDFGPGIFRPRLVETRSLLARALARAWAADEPADTAIRFADLPASNPFYRSATIAVHHGWIPKYSGNRWAGAFAAPRSLVDQALTVAMGLSAQIRGLAGIHQTDGHRYAVVPRFAHMQLAASLRLHYNHGTESLDLQPGSHMTRDEVAYSLYMSKIVPSWEIGATARFATIALPDFAAGTTPERLTQYALNQVGYPYIYGGEWNAATPPGYCCGAQPQGGFDCSGFMWWVLKKNEDGYDGARSRTYMGWSLHQRTSSSMALAAPARLPMSGLRIGNLMFFASNGGHVWSDVDHVGMYLGGSWMIHATSGGPQLEWVGSGWYHDHFVYGRGLVGEGPLSGSNATASPSLPQGGATQQGDQPVDDGRLVAVDPSAQG